MPIETGWFTEVKQEHVKYYGVRSGFHKFWNCLTLDQ